MYDKYKPAMHNATQKIAIVCYVVDYTKICIRKYTVQHSKQQHTLQVSSSCGARHKRMSISITAASAVIHNR